MSRERGLLAARVAEMQAGVQVTQIHSHDITLFVFVHKIVIFFITFIHFTTKSIHQLIIFFLNYNKTPLWKIQYCVDFMGVSELVYIT